MVATTLIHPIVPPKHRKTDRDVTLEVVSHSHPWADPRAARADRCTQSALPHERLPEIRGALAAHDRGRSERSSNRGVEARQATMSDQKDRKMIGRTRVTCTAGGARERAGASLRGLIRNVALDLPPTGSGRVDPHLRTASWLPRRPSAPPSRPRAHVHICRGRRADATWFRLRCSSTGSWSRNIGYRIAAWSAPIIEISIRPFKRSATSRSTAGSISHLMTTARCGWYVGGARERASASM